MASFFIPLTGLEADSTALNTIANNLANMNTTAYKAQTTNFSDLFYQQIGQAGSGDPTQVGAGVKIASITSDFTVGGQNSTGVSSNVALSGNGLFVLSNGSSNEFTRDGNFTVASNGNLTTQDGLDVMGYPAVNGVVNTNAPLTTINIPVGEVEAPQATSTFSMTANLNSTTATGSGFPGQVTLYDSLGNPQVATVTYTETGINTWNYSIALPAASFTSGVSTPVTGTMTFATNGTLSQVNGTNVGTAVGDASSIPVAFNGLKDGSANLSMNWNLLSAAGKPTISQVNAASAVAATAQDGYTSGEYNGFTISKNGTVEATFTNGQTQAIGQLALANVTNLQGLQLQGDGAYATTLASGAASFGVSGAAGLGAMTDGALEQSNVNISAEFSDLIIAQRAFEANSKAITTFDTVTQETINMVH
jgi:flagellar hook protein FlgE